MLIFSLKKPNLTHIFFHPKQLFACFIAAIAAAKENVKSPFTAIAATTTRPTPIAASVAYNPFLRNNFNNYGRYNPSTGRYEQYNPYTGRYDANYNDRFNQNSGLYQRNWRNGYFNPHTGRYEYNSRYNALTERLDNNRYDGQYYQNTAFARKFGPEVYGRGSVDAVHVPLRRYIDEGKWNILRDDRNANDGDYHYSYETENGIRAAEDSHQENKHTPAETSRKTGFYEYVGDDGKTYRVDWVADENGYRAEVSQRRINCAIEFPYITTCPILFANRERIYQLHRPFPITFNGRWTILPPRIWGNHRK